jgi:hypothetical protein
MHRSRAPSIAPGTFFVAQSWAGCITNMPGFNLRQAQPFDYGPGRNNRKRIKNTREEAIETNEHQSVDGTEGLFLGGGSSQNNDLLPQR